MTPSTRNRRLSTPILWLSACLASVVVAEAKGYMTPAFQSKESRPMTVALLPPHAEFIKAKAVMTDEMVKESEALENEAAGSIAALLDQKGYRTRILATKDFEGTPGLRELVKALNDRYNEEWGKIVRKPRNVKEGRYGAGEDVVKLCSLLKVDGVAIARIQAVGVTAGKSVLTALMSGGNVYAQSYARIDLSVLEGKKGQVEGYFNGIQPCTLKALLNKPGIVMEKTSKRVLRGYPEADEIKIAKATATSDDKKADDKEDEEDPIKDFEVLLGPEKEPEPQEAAPR